jgi:hypothetical protein
METPQLTKKPRERLPFSEQRIGQPPNYIHYPIFEGEVRRYATRPIRMLTSRLGAGVKSSSPPVTVSQDGAAIAGHPPSTGEVATPCVAQADRIPLRRKTVLAESGNQAFTIIRKPGQVLKWWEERYILIKAKLCVIWPLGRIGKAALRRGRRYAGSQKRRKRDCVVHPSSGNWSSQFIKNR